MKDKYEKPKRTGNQRETKVKTKTKDLYEELLIKKREFIRSLRFLQLEPVSPWDSYDLSFSFTACPRIRTRVTRSHQGIA
jgi:hypothetical protein